MSTDETREDHGAAGFCTDHGLPADTEGIARVLREHHHQYDSDCGVDQGCLCGWDLASGLTGDECNAQHADHLAGVLAAYLAEEPR